MIQIQEDLSKRKGDTVTFALVNELMGNGVTGNNTLKGNEERMGLRSMSLTVDVLRHAVAVDDWDEQKSVIDLRDAARVQLREWSMKQLRDSITQALGQVDGVNFESATTNQRNSWCANNQDRLLFGTRTSNYNATFANGIAAISVSDQCSPLALSLLKRMAQAASPRIKPLYVKEMDQEWFVCFVGPRCWRDLTENNPTTNVLTLANRDARVRGVDNPLFTGDSLVWDGMILRDCAACHALWFWWCADRAGVSVRRTSSGHRVGTAHQDHDGHGRLRVLAWRRGPGNPAYRETSLRHCGRSRPDHSQGSRDCDGLLRCGC
jgi:hypothetical protein